MNYPYDPDTRRLMAGLLWQALPAYYRTKDAPPLGPGDLRKLLEILAIPLAVARQNIEELYANLFIDTADDWLIPYLAQTVGVTLVFPDAAANRLDVRDTISWRRRKGTPAMLQELGGTLSGQLVVTQEGWKLVQMTQNLNLLRRERVIPHLRPPIVAELAEGPLGRLHHAVDVRAISNTTGRYHPRHVFHWAHPTLMFEVVQGTPARLADPAVPIDFRYAFHPLGEDLPLRARRTSERDALRTDRVPALHFAATPGDWFGVEGRFSVQFHGIPAAVAGPASEPARRPAGLAATVEVLEGSTSIALLDHDPRKFSGPVRVQLVAVPLAGALPDIASPGVEVRSSLELDAAGASAFAVANAGPVSAGALPMLRLQPPGVGARYFPGATIELSSDSPAGLLASHDSEAAREGSRRGALVVKLPSTRVEGDRWFHLAADGSLYEAQSTGTGAADLPLQDPGGLRLFDPASLRAASPGPAWPALPAVSDPVPLTRLPTAPALPPAVLHGGETLELQGGVWAPVPPATECALIFAASSFSTQRDYAPFLRLQWTGSAPGAAVAVVLGNDGLPAANAEARFGEIADLRATAPHQFRLAARFESSLADAVFTPAEVALTSFDGVSVLAYLPQLAAQPGSPVAGWPSDPLFAGASPAITVAEDGSTWQDGGSANVRRSLGQVAPMAQYPALRRRRVRARVLCPWRNETALLQHAATVAGGLDVDVDHGLFSVALAEPPSGVTVTWQEGCTMHLGARSAAREPELDLPLPQPTRLVSASGHLHREAPSAWLQLPRFSTLAAALQAIQAAPLAREIIQFEDSATYPTENLVWPAGCDELTIQAAERERPVIEIDAMSSAPGAQFRLWSLLGLELGSGVINSLPCPLSERVLIQFCTVNRGRNVLEFQLRPTAGGGGIDLERSITGGLLLTGPGALRVRTSVVDAGAGLGQNAIVASLGTVDLTEVTVFGKVSVFELEASEVIFNDDVSVEDRFRGCVRYSRVTSGSTLPRQHRTVKDLEARYVTVNRAAPAHARLAQSCPREILRGAEDGSEMGAFKAVQQAQRAEAFLRRMIEYTPAGLATGILRRD